MFDDIGSKIKGLAIGVFALGAIGAGILGLVLMSNEVVLFGLLIMAAGIAIAYVGSFRLYGYGQLIENSDAIVQLLKEAKERERLSPSRSASPPPATPSKASGSSGVTVPAWSPKPKTVPKVDPKAKKVHISGPRQGQIFCPDCGKAQSAFQDVCWNCGAMFIFDDEPASEELKPGEGETVVRCGKCGKDYIAPAGKSATCPHCGSSVMCYF